MSDGNNHVVLIVGKPSSGKSTSLAWLNDPKNIVYLNSDLKDLPFRSKFLEVRLEDPEDAIAAVQEFEVHDTAHTCVVDTLTYLMNMYEQQKVLTAVDSRQAWQDYAKYYRSLLHEVKTGTKTYFVLAHTQDIMNETDMVLESKIPIKGAVGYTGAEADFTTILGAKRISTKEAKKWMKDNDLLTISDEEEEDGVKYVFQTRIDKKSLGEKMRSHMGLWKRSEKYINNDLNLVSQRLNEYYS